MELIDPRKTFSINNFGKVNLEDAVQWGRALDLKTLNSKYGDNRDFSESISNMRLDRHATEPLDWTITAMRNWEPQNGSSYNAPMQIDLNAYFGGGNAMATNELYGANLPPVFGGASGNVFGMIPLHGIAIHFVSETCIINVSGKTYNVAAANRPKTDTLIAWIARGRPTEYYVTKVLYYDPTTPNQIPITIPAFSVSCTIASFDVPVAPGARPRVTSSIRFSSEFPPAPAPAPTGFQYSILATDNNNEINIPWDAYTIWDAGGGPTARQTMIKFKCIS